MRISLLFAVRNVGISQGKIARIAAEKLAGKRVIEWTPMPSMFSSNYSSITAPMPILPESAQHTIWLARRI